MYMSPGYKGDILYRRHVILRSAEVVSWRSCNSLHVGDVYGSCVKCGCVFLTSTDQLWPLIELGLLKTSAKWEVCCCPLLLNMAVQIVAHTCDKKTNM